MSAELCPLAWKLYTARMVGAIAGVDKALAQASGQRVKWAGGLPKKHVAATAKVLELDAITPDELSALNEKWQGLRVGLLKKNSSDPEEAGDSDEPAVVEGGSARRKPRRPLKHGHKIGEEDIDPATGWVKQCTESFELCALDAGMQSTTTARLSLALFTV